MSRRNIAIVIGSLLVLIVGLPVAALTVCLMFASSSASANDPTPQASDAQDVNAIHFERPALKDTAWKHQAHNLVYARFLPERTSLVYFRQPGDLQGLYVFVGGLGALHFQVKTGLPVLTHVWPVVTPPHQRPTRLSVWTPILTQLDGDPQLELLGSSGAYDCPERTSATLPLTLPVARATFAAPERPSDTVFGRQRQAIYEDIHPAAAKSGRAERLDFERRSGTSEPAYEPSPWDVEIAEYARDMEQIGQWLSPGQIADELARRYKQREDDFVAMSFRAITTQVPVHELAHDVDGNGYPDLIHIENSELTVAFCSEAQPPATVSTPLQAGRGRAGGTWADLEGDGALEWMWHESDSVTVFKLNEQRTFGTRSFGGTYWPSSLGNLMVSRLIPVTLDNDQLTDFITLGDPLGAALELHAYRNTGDGPMKHVAQKLASLDFLNLTEDAYPIAHLNDWAADLNGDHMTDFVLRMNGGVLLLLSLGSPLEYGKAVLDAGGPVDSILIEDVTQDGRLDIVVTTDTGTLEALTVFENQEGAAASGDRMESPQRSEAGRTSLREPDHSTSQDGRPAPGATTAEDKPKVDVNNASDAELLVALRGCKTHTSFLAMLKQLDRYKRTEAASMQLFQLQKDAPSDALLNLQVAWFYLARGSALKADNSGVNAYLQQALAITEKVIAVDGQNWEARFTKALVYSKSSVLGRQATGLLSSLIESQEKTTPADPAWAESYLLLGDIHAQLAPVDGEPLPAAMAMRAWEAGLKLFPNNAELKARIAGQAGNARPSGDSGGAEDGPGLVGGALDVKACTDTELYAALTAQTTHRGFLPLWERTVAAKRADGALTAFRVQFAREPKNPDMLLTSAFIGLGTLRGLKESDSRIGYTLMGIQSNCDELLKQRPTHWEAQYVRAFALSKNPPVLGGPTKAIDALTALQAQQEKAEQQKPEYVDTYLLLTDIYRLQPTPDANAKAVKVIRAGLGFFPDSSELRERLAALTK